MTTENKSPLVNANELAHAAYGLWSMDSGGDIGYTDGDVAENMLRRILENARDRTSGSLELEAAVFDWVSGYHLSAARANIYRFLNLEGVATGLELGSGCGAVTRYLGEQGINLDAVEGNRRRAEICRLRCNELENVHVVHANFNELRLPEAAYDAVFLNGVLEYARRFLPGSTDDRTALVEVLQRSLAALKPDGLLCIAIENRNGLKYWLGAAEDHFGKPYVGLYGYPEEEEGIRTYDRVEWEAIISSLDGGFNFRFMYPFPDYKLARAILSENFVRENPFAYSHLFRMASTDNGRPIESDKHEFLLWEGLHKAGRLPDFANSFFIVLAKDSRRLDTACPYDFMHVSGTGRKPGYRTLTRRETTSPVVSKKPLHGGEPAATADLTHNLDDAPYLHGSLLATGWLHALLRDDDAFFAECIRTYYRFLVQYWEEHDDVAGAFDLLPFNIVVAEDGTYRQIDREWQVHRPFTPEFVLFRALLWFPSANELLLKPLVERRELETVADFVAYGFEAASLSLNEKLDEFIALEESVQADIEMQVRPHPVRSLLRQSLKRVPEGALPDILPVQLYWSDGDADWSEERSLEVLARTGVTSQEVTFRLPPGLGSIARLRLDPANRAGYMHINSLQLHGNKPGEGSGVTELLWELDGGSRIAAAAAMENLHYCRNDLGEIFMATGDDPFLVFQLPAALAEQVNRDGATLTVEMDWPRSADFMIVMDSLGKKIVRQELERKQAIEETTRKYAAELKERRDQVRAKEIHIENLERELAAMQQTRVWRTAETLRLKVVYPLQNAKTLGRKGVQTLRQEGVRQFVRKTRRQLSGGTPSAETIGLCRRDYDLWVEKHRLHDEDLAEIKKNMARFGTQPLISIVVPVYNVDEIWLTKTIESVRNQLYENWELCLCDDRSPSPHIRQVLERYAGMDERIKVLFSEENNGIAVTSNKALSLAEGDYVGLLDHDDELSVDALYEVVRAINEHPDAGLIYSDEDKLDMQGHRVDPFFKPDFSPELIYSQNYICHFTVISKVIVDDIGGFRAGFDGSQDHDLILRASEKARYIHHIPRVLYHWRKIPGSTAAIYDSKSYAWEAGRKAVEESLARTGVKGRVTLGRFQGTYRVQRDITGSPLVSIVIPFKDKPDLLQKCIGSIISKSTYPHFEVVGISNNSSEKTTFKTMDTLAKQDSRVRFAEYNVEFNFADICNHGVELARGEYVLLLNNDIEVITPEWLENMLELAQVEGIGAVGCKLYYPDNRVQHDGIVMGLAGVAGLPHHFFHKDDVGYYGRPHVIHNVSAVTGACMLLSKKLYQEVGGMDSVHFAVAYNDVDLCLKLLKKGCRIVVTPYSELIHYESVTRGYEDTPEKMTRLQKEAAFLAQKWPEYVKGEDPYYSPHLSLDRENFSIRL